MVLHVLRVLDACLRPLSLGPLLLVTDVAHIAQELDVGLVRLRRSVSAVNRVTWGYHARWLERVHTLNEKGKTEMILLKACTYKVDNAKGRLYNLRYGEHNLAYQEYLGVYG